jgi:hypothetical protein
MVRERLGALSEEAAFTDGEDAENAAARRSQARGALLSDMAVLFDALGETPAAISAASGAADLPPLRPK